MTPWPSRSGIPPPGRRTGWRASRCRRSASARGKPASFAGGLKRMIQSIMFLSLFGRVFFGVQYRGSFFLAVVFLLLTTVVLACLGILSASFAMVFKRGDPFGIFLGAGSALFSGVFFPTQLLKAHAGPALGSISLLLPATHGLQGIRQVLIEGHGLAQVTQPLFTLLAFLVVLLPFSLWVFGRAVRRAKREGSLIQY